MYPSYIGVIVLCVVEYIYLEGEEETPKPSNLLMGL